MKKLLVLMMMMMMIAIPVFTESISSIVVKNDTGYDFTEVFISLSSSDDWNDDYLEGDSLSDGSSRTIYLRDDSDDCDYDFMAVDIDGDDYTKFNINLCSSNGTVIFTFDDYGDGSDEDDYSYDSSYDDGYDEGYRAGYRDAYRDAYRDGFHDAMNESMAQ